MVCYFVFALVFSFVYIYPKFINYIMKKLFFIALGLVILSCNKQGDEKAFKTAYVDTDKLMEKYQKAIDIENKYKIKSEEMGRELDAEAKQFQTDYENASKLAQTKGPQWAQQKGMEFQQREQQLNIKQQTMLKEIQTASGTEMDSLVSEMKTFIKDFGKKNNYDYVYGTGSVATVLYAKDSYDITDQLINELNKSYKPTEEKKESDNKEDKK